MRHISARAIVLGIVLAAACGETAERRSMKRLAGTYRWDDSVAGAVLTRTMTLSPEGKASLTQELTLQRGEPRTSSVTGTYSAGEGTITTRFGQGDVLTYTILGDTLFPRLGPRERQMESMTGVKGGSNMGDQRLVRVR